MGPIVPFRTSRSRSRSAGTLAAAVAVALLLAVFPAAFARAADDSVAAEAKKHYEEGTKAFNLGEYPRAIAEFKAAYNAKPDPLLLYNIAQSYRLAEDAGQALFFYKSFLRNMPSATNRKEVEGRIKELDRKVAEQKKDPSSAPPPVIVPVLPSITTPPPTTSATTTPPVSPPPPATSPPSNAGSIGSRTDPPRKATTNATPTPTLEPPWSPPPPTSPEPHVDLTAPAPAAPEEESRPIYKKWWFWAGAAGVLIVITGLAAANARKPPETALGIWDPTWMSP